MTVEVQELLRQGLAKLVDNPLIVRVRQADHWRISLLGPASATFHYELIGLIPHAIDTTRKQDAFACWTVSRSVRVLSEYCHDDSGTFAPKCAVCLRLSSAAETTIVEPNFYRMTPIARLVNRTCSKKICFSQCNQAHGNVLGPRVSTMVFALKAPILRGGLILPYPAEGIYI